MRKSTSGAALLQRGQGRRDAEIAIVGGADNETQRCALGIKIFRPLEGKLQPLQGIADRYGELKRARRRTHTLRRPDEEFVVEEGRANARARCSRWAASGRCVPPRARRCARSAEHRKRSAD